MKLHKLHRNDQATIVSVDADTTLKNRPASLGIMPNETLTLKQVSLGKQTIEIEIDGTLVVLRRNEASRIVVTKD